MASRPFSSIPCTDKLSTPPRSCAPPMPRLSSSGSGGAGLILSDDPAAVTELAAMCHSLLWVRPQRSGSTRLPAALTNARVQHMKPPMGWPCGYFDLIVLDEPLRTRTELELHQIAALCMSSLSLRGTVVLRLRADGAAQRSECERIARALSTGWSLLQTVEEYHSGMVVSAWTRELMESTGWPGLRRFARQWTAARQTHCPAHASAAAR